MSATIEDMPNAPGYEISCNDDELSFDDEDSENCSTITSYTSYSAASIGSEYEDIFAEMKDLKPKTIASSKLADKVKDIDGIFREEEEECPVRSSFLRIRELLADPESKLNILLDDEDLTRTSVEASSVHEDPHQPPMSPIGSYIECTPQDVVGLSTNRFASHLDSTPKRPKRTDSLRSLTVGSSHHKRVFVKFTTVNVRLYERVVGDIVPKSSGPGISIGWKYESEAPVAINVWENQRSGNRRRPSQLILSRRNREKIAKELNEPDNAQTEQIFSGINTLSLKSKAQTRWSSTTEGCKMSKNCTNEEFLRLGMKVGIKHRRFASYAATSNARMAQSYSRYSR